MQNLVVIFFRFRGKGCLFRELFLNCLDNGDDIGKGDANDDKQGVFKDVHQPALVLVKIGKIGLRRADNVHKIDVDTAARFVQHTVDIKGEEHQNDQKFQAVEVVFYLKLYFLACVQIQGEYHEKNVIAEVLRANQPASVSRRIGGD